MRLHSDGGWAGVISWFTRVSGVGAHHGLITQLRLVATLPMFVASPCGLSTSLWHGDKAGRQAGDHCISFYEFALAVT